MFRAVLPFPGTGASSYIRDTHDCFYKAMLQHGSIYKYWVYPVVIDERHCKRESYYFLKPSYAKQEHDSNYRFHLIHKADQLRRYLTDYMGTASFIWFYKDAVIGTRYLEAELPNLRPMKYCFRNYAYAGSLPFETFEQLYGKVVFL